MGSVNRILCCIVYFNFNIRKENKTLRFHCFKMSPNFSHRRLNSLEIRPITSQNNRWSTCCFRGFCTDVLGFCTFFRSLIIKFDAQLQKDPHFTISLYNITTRSGMEVTRLNEMNTWLIFERFYQLGKGFRSSERKLGVTTHFSEIINVQFGKNALYIVMYFNGFLLLEILLLNVLWVRGYAQFSLWIPTALTEICFSRKVTSDGKILLY